MTGVASERWGAASGLGALATGAAAVVFERGGVSPNDSPARMAAFFAENRSALRMQALLFVVGSAFFLWFLGSLVSYLAAAASGRGGLATVAFGAGVASTTVTLVALSVQVGISTAPAEAQLAALVATMTALFTVANLPLAVMLVAVAVLSVQPGAFPRWLAVLSVVAAIALALPVFGLAQTSGLLAVGSPVAAYLPYPLYVAWLAGATALLVGRVGRVRPDRGTRTSGAASAVDAPAGGGR